MGGLVLFNFIFFCKAHKQSEAATAAMTGELKDFEAKFHREIKTPAELCEFEVGFNRDIKKLCKVQTKAGIDRL